MELGVGCVHAVQSLWRSSVREPGGTFFEPCPHYPGRGPPKPGPPRGSLIAKEIKKERKKKRKATDVLETPSLWWLLRLLRLLWLLWLPSFRGFCGFTVSFCSFCGFVWLGGLRPSPGSQLGSRPGTSSAECCFFVAGMAVNGRETWQSGTWRSHNCGVVRAG